MSLRYGATGQRRVDLLNALLEQTGGLCALCGELLTVETLSIDHIVPQSRGGSHTIENLQAAHRACNSRKHNRLPSDPPPVEKPLVHLVMDEAFIERIDDFRFANRFPSRAAAIKWLLDAALKQGLKPSTT